MESNKYIIVLEYGTESIGNSISNIIEMLNSIGKTLQLTEHSFMMLSVDTAVVIRDAIKNSPYDIESIFVAEVDSPAAWRSLAADNNDVKTFLRNEL